MAAALVIGGLHVVPWLALWVTWVMIYCAIRARADLHR